MPTLDQELTARLARLRGENLYRELRQIDSPQSRLVQSQGQELLNFSSNDYLGAANEPSVKEAAIRATGKFGAGCGASRLVCGSLAPHHELEEHIATFKGVEAALTFSSGYAAALGAICSIMGTDDIVILDKLVHASLVDAARLSGAKLRIYDHNDLAQLENILQWGAGRSAGADSRMLIVTESVFSMDGDMAPLSEIVALKEHYGAWLLVDEAHATGLYGPQRRGLIEELGLCNQVELQMGTLGKALGSAGGYLCGSRTVRDYLINRARSFIFSTAPVPASAAAAQAGIVFVQSGLGEERRDRLWDHIDSFSNGICSEPWRPQIRGAILPILLGSEGRAVKVAQSLRQRGLLIPAIRYPSVPRGAARLRITLSASHHAGDISRLIQELTALLRETELPIGC